MGMYAVVYWAESPKGMAEVEYCGMWQVYCGAFNLPGFESCICTQVS